MHHVGLLAGLQRLAVLDRVRQRNSQLRRGVQPDAVDKACEQGPRKTQREYLAA
jgi:hypothetical protein